MIIIFFLQKEVIKVIKKTITKSMFTLLFILPKGLFLVGKRWGTESTFKSFNTFVKNVNFLKSKETILILPCWLMNAYRKVLKKDVASAVSHL
jgi:hypothetical protein